MNTMNTLAPLLTTRRNNISGVRFALFLLLALGTLLLSSPSTFAAQKRLPSAERIIKDHLKASLLNRRAARLTGTVYEWSADADKSVNAATLRTRDGAMRLDLHAPGLKWTAHGATARTAWRQTTDGTIQTLTGAQQNAARLTALLLGSQFKDHQKLGIGARTTGVESLPGDATPVEDAYIVEFTSRDGARVRFMFGAQTKLLRALYDDANNLTLRFGDYAASENGALEPQRMMIEIGEQNPTRSIALRLQSVRRNVSLSEEIFNPPSAERIDVQALLKELRTTRRNRDIKLEEFTYTVKQTETTLAKDGSIKEQTVSTYETYLTPRGRSVRKLVAINGKPLSPERQAKEEARVVAALERAEREPPPVKEADTNRPRTIITLNDTQITIEDIARICEFVAPRREQFQNRDAVVFSFRTRPEFRPRTDAEKMLDKVTGQLWMDVADKAVMRLEMRLNESFKIGGGLVLSIKPGAAIIFETTKLPEYDLWAPRLIQLNANGRALLFSEINVLNTSAFGDFRRFKTSTDDASVDAPQP